MNKVRELVRRYYELLTGHKAYMIDDWHFFEGLLDLAEDVAKYQKSTKLPEIEMLMGILLKDIDSHTEDFFTLGTPGYFVFPSPNRGTHVTCRSLVVKLYQQVWIDIRRRMNSRGIRLATDVQPAAAELTWNKGELSPTLSVYTKRFDEILYSFPIQVRPDGTYHSGKSIDLLATELMMRIGVAKEDNNASTGLAYHQI